MRRQAFPGGWIDSWRGTLLGVLLAVGAGATVAGRATADQTEPSATPNIVVILADDLGYGEPACLNPEHSRIPTPVFDRLAREGMVYTDAHAGSSLCTPTRYGLLTGRYAWRTRLSHGVLSEASCPPLITGERLTLPALLRSRGYTTACIGKWHLGFQIEEDGLTATTADGPLTRGFDQFVGFTYSRDMRRVFEGDRVTRVVEPVEMLPLLVAEADQFIRQQAGRGPFFLYLALNSPHTPIRPSPAWQGRSGLGDYADFVMQTDAAVGQVLDAIDQAGIAADTLLFCTSDNGSSPESKPAVLARRGHHVSGPYRGIKADIWEGGHRVPFLVRWPGCVAAGKTCDRLVCLTDLMATLGELVGAPIPAAAAEDSVSFLPSLRGESQPQRSAVVHHSGKGQFAIRDGRWKLCLGPGSGGWSRPTDAQALADGLPELQLYDLDADSAERFNLASSKPEIVARLKKVFAGFVTEGRSTPGPLQANERAVPAP